MPDDSYKDLQEILVNNPEAGDIIIGGGGLRKIRWNLPGKVNEVVQALFIIG